MCLWAHWTGWNYFQFKRTNIYDMKNRCNNNNELRHIELYKLLTRWVRRLHKYRLHRNFILCGNVFGVRDRAWIESLLMSKMWNWNVWTKNVSWKGWKFSHFFIFSNIQNFVPGAYIHQLSAFLSYTLSHSYSHSIRI